MDNFYCRVCGLFFKESPWGVDGKSPSYDICPCCGVEFGNEDYEYSSVIEYRAQWLNSNHQWNIPRLKPKEWSLEKQLLQIPKEWK